MKNKRALTLLLAASMVIPQFAVFASAASDYNYINLEEEVIIENGTFDEEPWVSLDSKREYHVLPSGAWTYQYNNTGTASVEYAKDGDNGYLKVTAAGANPSVAYAIGEVEKGEYVLTLDVYPESSDITGMTVQVFYLDDNFSVSDTKYRLNTKNFPVTANANNSLSVSVSLAEDTNIAFRVYSTPDAPANGNFRIDNVSLGRPATDILIESANLGVADNETAYSSVADIPVNTWASSAVDYMSFTPGDNCMQVVKKEDGKLAINPTVMYAFKNPLAPGNYRLTLVVDTADTKPGWISMIGAVTNVTTKTSHEEPLTSPYTYTWGFTVPEGDPIPVGFRYWSNADVVPAEPFSITSMTLEKDNGTKTLTEHDPITIIENKSTDPDHPFVIDTDADTNTGVSGKWSLSGKADATLSLVDGVLKFEEKSANDGGKKPNLLYNMGILEAGSYIIKLTINMTSGRTSGAQFDVRHPVDPAPEGQNPTYSGFNPGPGINWQPDNSVTFTISEQQRNCVLRFYPHDKGKNEQYIYTVDNFSVVKTASYATGWTPVENYDFTSAPTIYSDNGVAHDKMTASGTEGYEKYAGKWCVRNNSFGAVYLEHDATNECLKVVGRDSAICGKPVVMYKFSTPLSAGDYGVEINVGSYAADWDRYNYKVVDAVTGEVLPGASKTDIDLKPNSDNIVSIEFTLESDHNVALVIEPVKRDSREHINAYDIKSATLSKLSKTPVQLRSNAAIATFDSTGGTYYKAVNAQSNIYIKYFANTNFRSGHYMLSAEFKTDAAQDVQLSAYFANQNLDVNTIETGDAWQTFEYPVTLKHGTALSASNAIRFDVDSTEPLYMRNLKLVFVEDLTKPAINPAIAMILLKKMEGTYAGHISTKPVEYVINGEFDTEVNIDHDQSRAYLNHEDGRWTYSKNTGDVKAYVHEDGYAYFEVADANPTVGHKVGTLPAGSYTLSFEINPEYNIGNIRTRIFKLSDGFAVGKVEYVIADNTASIKVGEKNTITYNFELTEETTVAFNFYATKEKPCPEKGNFRLDNVSVTCKP